MTSETPSSQYPLHLGDPEDFARMESLLKTASFDEPTICRVFKIEDMSDIGSVKPEETDLITAGSELLALLIKIFLFLESLGRDEVERLIDPAALRSLLALDVLRLGHFSSQGVDAGEVFYSPVLLYPVAGLLIASDRHNNPDGSPFVPPPDIVFPAIYSGTLRFLRVISKSPVSNALDLCSGSGIGALVLSANAQHVVAGDITARALHFINFNRRLNYRFNVEPLQGDLYSPVEGRTFDRIVAHPPYVPSFSDTMIYRDAGETGEALIRRIIEGLPSYLSPGGTFYSVCGGLDTAEGLFEERARRWLGEAQDQFDLILGLSSEISRAQLARRLVERTQGATLSDIERWDQVFSRVGMHQLVYGALIIHRRPVTNRTSLTPAAQPLTKRYRLSAETDGACFEWALRWHHWRSGKEALGELSHAISNFKPRLAPALQVKVTHVVRQGALVPAEFVLASEKPFLAATKVDPWMVPVMAEFDGQRTSAEVYEAVSEASALPESFKFSDFIDLVVKMFDRGYLDADDLLLEN